jgi:hypothetical protein
MVEARRGLGQAAPNLRDQSSAEVPLFRGLRLHIVLHAIRVHDLSFHDVCSTLRTAFAGGSGTARYGHYGHDLYRLAREHREVRMVLEQLGSGLV